jgi:hypothetical protein
LRLCFLDINAFSFETRTESFPMSCRRDENHTFPVRQCGSGEAADGSVEKLLILVKLNNMILGPRILKETSPRFETISLVPLPPADMGKARHEL